MRREKRPERSGYEIEHPERIKGNYRSSGNSQDAPRLADPFLLSKKDIHFSEHKGRFLKKCPGTLPGYLCCNYYVLNIQTNCNFNCHYCILQGYINSDKISVFTNLDTALNEVKELLENNQNKFYRIGTGELTDSLSLDYITNSSKELSAFFLEHKNALLELKTKSGNIDNLMHIKPCKNIVISWSLNPQSIINKYETGTASLSERLSCAKECLKAGYSIGFHLDPVILSPDCEQEYEDLLNQIFKHIPKDSIIWLSIAGFRYPRFLQNAIQERFPKTDLFLNEMSKGEDGKYRYLRPVRTGIYKKIISSLKKYDPCLPIYFCMESPAVWRDVFGNMPDKIDNLKGIFGRLEKPIRLYS